MAKKVLVLGLLLRRFVIGYMLTNDISIVVQLLPRFGGGIVEGL